MAIGKIMIEVIKQVADQIPQKPVKLVTVGYPDCIIADDVLKKMCGPDIMDKVTFRDDSEAIIKWHGLQGLLEKVVETDSLFKAMNIEMTVLDINEIRGKEIICDLNQPIPDDLAGSFDIVIDAGTMEHCFNVGQVISNLLSLARVGGVIAHGNPLNVINHGFYNFSPTFYHDFYNDNGHGLVSPIYGFIWNGLNYQAWQMHPIQRVRNMPENTWILAVAKKLNDNPPKWPMQTKYKMNPTLSG